MEKTQKNPPILHPVIAISQIEIETKNGSNVFYYSTKNEAFTLFVKLYDVYLKEGTILNSTNLDNEIIHTFDIQGFTVSIKLINL